MTLRSLLSGTMALTLAGLYARITGTIFRVLLVRLIGDTGIGLLQMAMPVYSLALTVATLGLPPVLAKAVAELEARSDWTGAARQKSIVVGLVGFATASTCVALYFLSDFLSSSVLTDPRTGRAIALMPPAVAAASVAAVLKGYFQGKNELTPSAWAQVVEQTVRIPAVLLLGAAFLNKGLDFAVAGVMAGVACGELAGLAYLLWRYHQHRATWPNIHGHRMEEHMASTWLPSTLSPRLTTRLWDDASGLLRLSLPLMFGGVLASLTAAADALIIPRRLEVAGWDNAEATRLYGQLSGMALPVLFLPMVVIYPLATAMTPAVSAAAATGDLKGVMARMRFGIQVTLAVAGLTAASFLTLPSQIARLLYGNAEIAPLIALFALSAPVVYLQNILGAYMTGLGLTGQEFRNYLTGLTARIAVIYIATGIPSLGLAGAVLGITTGQTIMAVLHICAIRRKMRHLASL